MKAGLRIFRGGFEGLRYIGKIREQINTPGTHLCIQFASWRKDSRTVGRIREAGATRYVHPITNQQITTPEV